MLNTCGKKLLIHVNKTSQGCCFSFDFISLIDFSGEKKANCVIVHVLESQCELVYTACREHSASSSSI